ncbi:MAG TPA: hypothetical protein VFT62_00765 [Mycobacteriales bacterium]|nr:hypothetical protein [Mycobacteriales bacterium]
MRPGIRTTVHVALTAVVAVLLGGCGLTHLQDLNFRVDDRLHFTSPENRATVHQPLTVSWTMRDFRIAAQGSEPASDGAGYFAIFVDRAPIRPEQTMKAVAHGDRFCEQSPRCPDTAYLAQRQVYTTTKTTFRLPQIPNLVGSQEKLQLHSITVVLMDTAGHRIGESAWELDVRIPKVGFS